MKRMGIATLLVAAIVGLGPPASSSEAKRTEVAQYRGHSDERDCQTKELKEFWSVVCAAQSDAHHSAFSGRTRFGVPSWARSVQIWISDDAGLPVAFRVYFGEDSIQKYRFTNSTCAQTATVNLGAAKLVSVARIALGCGSSPTTGTVTARFSSKIVDHPSPRHYIAGCGLELTPFVGFSGGTCSYTASKSGGYFAAGVWDLRIVRGRTAIYREAARDAHCANKGFIQKGDFVTIRFLAGYVRAGDDAHC